MVLYGADTDQLRQLAENHRGCAQRMLEVSGRLTATITSVTWEGPDAEDFHRRWSELEAQIHGADERLRELGSELTDHAEQQDAASSPASDAIRGFLDGLAAGLGGLAGGLLPGFASAAEAGLAIGQDGAGASTAAAITPDEFDHERGADSSETEVVITLPDGTEITVGSEGDGTQTFAMNDPAKLEQKIDVGGLEVTHDIEVGREVEVKVNPDGSLTYTFTGTYEQGLEGAGESKYIDMKVGTSTTTESLYSVTVPPGTSFTDALAINPFNPESIPPDASITVGTGVEQASSLDLTGKYRGLEVGLGLEETVGSEVNTAISRDSEGSLSMLSGPTHMVRNDGTLSIGVDGAAFEMGTSHTNEHGVLEYAQYSNDAAGSTAYSNTLWADGYPSDTSVNGVTDRYTQTHTSTAMDSSVGVTIDKVLDVSRSHNTFADEVIHRSYPDGREEWAQQILPHGEGSGNSVYVHGGTGREAEYRMTLGDVPPIGDSSATNTYWGHEHSGGDLAVSFTQDELATMRENRSAWHGNPEQYTNEADYLASVVATASGQDADMVMQDLHRDYNVRPIEAGTWHHVEPVHPEERTPGRVR